MIRFQIISRQASGARFCAAGFFLAAAGPVLAGPSAFETLDAAASRELNAARGSGFVQPAQVEAAAGNGAPRPLPSIDRPVRSLNVGPTARFVKLPHDLTVSPNIQLASSPPAAGASRSGPTIQTVADTKPSGNPFKTFFSRGTSSSAAKRSASARTSKPSSTSTVSGGGLFGRMTRPFRKEEQQTPAPSEQPPVPPPLPNFSSRSATAKRTAAAAPDTRPSVQATPALQPGAVSRLTPPPAALPEPAEGDPFADVASEPAKITITPAPMHPLDDAFGDIRGDDAATGAATAVADPDFMAPVKIYDRGAPRPLDPETVESSEDFAPVRTPAPAAETRPQAAQRSASARMAEVKRKLAERSGLGGFQGFCPVALRDRRELVDARPEFLSVHNGRTYELSSAEAKARFEADPSRYAPAAGGKDPVLVSRGESEAEGSLAHAVWFKDRLYLFRTAETLRDFNREPAKFATVE